MNILIHFNYLCTMSRFFAFQSETCSILDTVALKYCIPKKYKCFDDPDGLLTECGKEYNCSECCDGVDMKFYLPFKTSDIIQIQSQIFDFYNADREVPLAGFGEWIEAVIVDLSNGTEQDISNYLGANGAFVGWNGKNSYQIVELDGALLPDCWQIKYRVYSNDSPQDEVQELCSQHFKNDAALCVDSILIQGIRTGFDAAGNYYDLPTASFGDPAYEYNNQIRIQAHIKTEVPEKTTYIRQGRTLTRSIKYRQAVNLYAVPMFVIKYLEDQILGAKNVKIDGKIYQAEAGTAEAIEDSCLFNYTFNLISIKNETEC